MAKIVKTDEDWKAELDAQEYHVCREKGTEAPFTGAFHDSKAEGTYSCTCCGEKLFSSSTKFDSGTGWPSYFKPINETAVSENRDEAYGMVRVEVVCSHCDSHLGHVFEDGPAPTGQRYCINSVSLKFQEK